MPACRAAGRELLRKLLDAELFPRPWRLLKAESSARVPSFGPSTALCHRCCARGLLRSASLHINTHSLRQAAVLLNICIAHAT